MLNAGNRRWEQQAPYVRFGMRVAAALLFLQHGLEKLFGFAGARPVPDLLAQRGIAGLLETIGPAFLALGLFPRFTAFILCGEMAVAYFQSWAPRGIWPIANGGEEAVLFCYFYLWIMTAGPGACSLDAWIDRQRGPHPFRAWKLWLASFEPYTRSVMRAIVGFLIIEHGARKVFNVLPVLAGRLNVPPLAIDGLPAITGYIDLVAGALLIVGLFTRPAALVVAAEMLAAYFVVAAPRGPWPIRNGGGEALMHLVIAVYLLLAGAGVLSLDCLFVKSVRFAAQARPCPPASSFTGLT
jgi:putative oxidoreductase